MVASLRPFFSLLREARAPLEIAQGLLLRSAASALPRGDGHAVMLLPAFTVGEREMQPLARSLEALGYVVHGWGEGRNLGLSAAALDRLITRLAGIAEQHGGPASLVGWSGGGLYAREMARARPELVRRVITLGAPIRFAEAGAAFVEQSRQRIGALAASVGLAMFEPELKPPPVPCTAIFSRRDGIVDWRAACERPGPADGAMVENVEVDSTHLGLAYSREVLAIIASRLALPATHPATPKRVRRKNSAASR